MTAVLKWPVPVDDRPYAIGGGPVVLVACQRGGDSVQVWTLESPGSQRTVQVFGTGQLLPENLGPHIGSCMWQSGALVWHVFEVQP